MEDRNGWQLTTLEKVANEITVGYVGPMTAEYVSNGVPFLRSQNIQPFRIDLTDIIYINESFHQSLRKSSLHPGDVVIVRTGKPGTAAMIPPSLSNANCSDLVIVRPGPELDSRFLVYYVNSSAQDHISAHLVGAVQQHFNVGSARKMQLYLPHIEEQRAIATVLGDLDDKIELNRRLNVTLEKLARAIFQSWFVDFDPVRATMEGRRPVGMDEATAALFPDRFEESELGEIPAGWKVGKLEDLAHNPRRGVNPGQFFQEMPYIGLEHMPRKSIALADWGSSDGLASNKFEFKRGEILFGKLRPYFHKVGIAPVDGVCSTDILVIVPKKAPWFAFVLGHVSSDDLIQHTNQGSTGTKMPRTNWSDIARYEVVVPHESIAQAFNEQMQHLYEMINVNIHQIRTLAAMRDTLLPKLLSGTVRALTPRPPLP